MKLLFDKGFIGGEWVEALSGNRFDVFYPVNDELVGSAPDMDSRDAERAILAAGKAFETWTETTATTRSKLLRRWYDLMQANSEDLAILITKETGKPLSEARQEVVYGNGFIEWYAGEATHIHGEIISCPWPDREIFHKRQPIGVVSLITPWNYPHAMVTRKAGAALAAGCTCVIKPAEDSPLTALALAHFAEEAGFPKGTINVVTCSRPNASSVGKVLCQNEEVAGVSFTGSTAVGKILYAQCATGVKRIGLELGGNSPFIVFPSADLDKALRGAMDCKFRNCGQTCICANRFLFHVTVFDKLVEGLGQAIDKELILGDPMNPKVKMGPLINDTQIAKVKGLVDDAVAKGAKLIKGGNVAMTFGKRYFEPTILLDVTDDMRISREEIFGPVAVCYKFTSEDEAIQIANSTRSGLAAYFYSTDMAQVWRVSRKLKFGIVGINEGIVSTPEAAFGGVKESGLGKEGSSHAVEDYTYIKYINLGGIS